MSLRASGVRLKVVQRIRAGGRARSVVDYLSVRIFLDLVSAIAIGPKVRAANNDIVAAFSPFLRFFNRQFTTAHDSAVWSK